MNKEEIKDVTSRLTQLYIRLMHKEPLPQILASDLKMLSAFEYKKVIVVIQKALFECDFYPKPKFFMENLQDRVNVTEEALQQVEYVVRAVNSSKYEGSLTAISKDIMTRTYSWSQLEDMNIDNLPFWKNKFVDIYKSKAEFQPELLAQGTRKQIEEPTREGYENQINELSDSFKPALN